MTRTRIALAIGLLACIYARGAWAVLPTYTPKPTHTAVATNTTAPTKTATTVPNTPTVTKTATITQTPTATYTAAKTPISGRNTQLHDTVINYVYCNRATSGAVAAWTGHKACLTSVYLEAPTPGTEVTLSDGNTNVLYQCPTGGCSVELGQYGGCYDTPLTVGGSGSASICWSPAGP